MEPGVWFRLSAGQEVTVRSSSTGVIRHDATDSCTLRCQQLRSGSGTEPGDGGRDRETGLIRFADSLQCGEELRNSGEGGLGIGVCREEISPILVWK